MHTPSPGARALAPTTPAISASFTPGPWREHSHRQIGPDAGIVCEVWSAIGWGDAAIQQADANVRLIAAAPETQGRPTGRPFFWPGCNNPAGLPVLPSEAPEP